MIRLVADLGNSVCKLVRANGLDVERRIALSHDDLRDSNRLNESIDELHRGAPIEEAVICSVVPDLTAVLEAACSERFASVVRVTAQELPILKLAYETLGTLGIDRYCNAVAGAGLYGAPCITVDLGTATTVNIVDESGAYRGGAIGVGIRTGYNALHAQTAQLPSLEPRWPDELIGVSTEDSMHAGVTGIHVLGLSEMLKRIKANFVTQPTVVFTGGNLQIIPREEFNDAVFDKDLLLKGAILYADQKKTNNSSDQ